MLSVSFSPDDPCVTSIKAYGFFCDGGLKEWPELKDVTACAEAAAFSGEEGAAEKFFVNKNGKFQHVILFGLGSKAHYSPHLAEKAGASLVGCLGNAKSQTITAHLPKTGHGDEGRVGINARFAFGFRLKSFQTKQFKAEKTDTAKHSLTVVTDRPEETAAAYRSMEAVGEGIEWARNLVSTPPNRLTPEIFSGELARLSEIGVCVTVCNETELEERGFDALLAVGRGSVNPPRLVTMEWRGDEESEAPLVVVGKGITFDSGGYWLKPSPIMELMKFDMGGAAAVAGLMRTLASRGAKANVIGIVALAENMIDGNAYRPGDVIDSLSGKTIEVINTDAEGRIVLADALHHATTAYKPYAVVDLATLTGAIVTALGPRYAGLYANDDGLASALQAAGENEDELVWRMPLHDDYDKQIDTDIADLKNLAKPGLMGILEGSPSIAAQFLQRFVNGVRWAHIDIAGTAWLVEGKPTSSKGATGFGVRLLNEFIFRSLECAKQK